MYLVPVSWNKGIEADEVFTRAVITCAGCSLLVGIPPAANSWKWRMLGDGFGGIEHDSQQDVVCEKKCAV